MLGRGKGTLRWLTAASCERLTARHIAVNRAARRAGVWPPPHGLAPQHLLRLRCTNRGRSKRPVRRPQQVGRAWRRRAPSARTSFVEYLRRILLDAEGYLRGWDSACTATPGIGRHLVLPYGNLSQTRLRYRTPATVHGYPVATQAGASPFHRSP